MDRKNLIADVKTIFEKELKVRADHLDLDTRLAEIDIDSLDVIKIALAVEKSFHVHITTGEIQGIERFGDIIDRLETKLKE